MPLRAISIALLALAAVAASMGSVASSTLPITPGPRTASPDRSTYPPSAEAPAGLLAAEGGDPVTGQLGTYVWRNTGSDSPWLPGSPITVGAGEPLAVTFHEAVGVATWRARMVPADADGPDGATLLGQGAGDPTFQAPGRGSWTVEVQIVFEAGAGDASYFWRLDVR